MSPAPGGWETWSWDESLFAGAAGYYEQGRLPYAPGLADAFACCGIAGLKTSYGRVPLDGVRPLAPSLDTVGPMAATVDGLVTGMALLEPGFTAAAAPARRIGRLRTTARPEIEQAVDEALKGAELEVVTLDWDGFAAGTSIFTTIEITQYIALFNAAGTPCTAQPIRAAGSPIPTSLQLLGPPRGEELLLATARQVEAAG